MTKQKTKPRTVSDNGTEEQDTLVFNLPDPDEPGFFKRALEVQELLEAYDAGGGSEALNKLLKYLTKYFDGTPEEIHEKLLMASRNQIGKLVRAIIGGVGSDPFG